MRRSLLRLTLALYAACFGSAMQVRADMPEQQFAEAAKAYGSGHWSDACRAFDKLLVEYPGHRRAGDARFFYGEALAQLERWEDARKQFAALRADDPQHRYARQALFRGGEAAFLDGDLQAAKGDLKTFQQEFPDDPLNGYVLPYLASIDYESGDYAGARQAFASALERFQAGPLADECRLGLARCQEQLKEFDSARRGFAAVADAGGPLADQAHYDGGTMENKLGDYAAAATLLERIEQRFPQSTLVPRAQLARAYALYRLGKFAEAEGLLTPLQQDTQLRVEAHYWLGLSQKGRADWTTAARTLQAAAPDRDHRLHAALTFHAADALLRDHQLPAAREQFTRALTDAPQGAWADDCLLGLMRIAVQQGQHNECARLRTQFAQQFAASPLRATVELAAGQALATQGKDLETTRALEAVLSEPALNENLTPEQRDEAKRTLGLCYARLGRLEAADQILAGLDDGPTASQVGAETRYQLAEAAYQAGKWDTACDQFARLVAPGNPPEIVRRALFSLGWSHFKANRWTEASAAFERLLQEFPDSPAAPEAALARGNALEQLQQWEPALAMYQAVLQQHAHSQWAADALWRAGQVQERLQQYEPAIASYQKLMRDHAPFAELDQAIYRCARLLLVAQRAQEAEALFARLEQDFPHSQYASEATLRRAEQALADGQPELAEQRLADFDCTAVPGELAQRALYVRGRAAQARGQWDAAETSLAALRERYPQCELAPTAAYLLGEIAYRRGKYPLAAERMAALNTSPDGPPQPWAATAELRRAQALAQEKKWDEAFDVARQIPDRFPHFADVHEVDYLIGRAKAAQADFDAARAAYAKVLASPAGAKSQTGALAQWMLGESYFHQENYPSALAEYAKLDERHPFPRLQAAALLQAAKCHEHLQQWPQAVASYEQLLAKYPESEWCSEAKGLLREARSRLAGGTPRRQ